MSEFPTPADSQPVGIAFAPDGALWFTERSGTKIGRMTLDGAVTEFNVPTEGSTPTHIALGPDGNMWFTEMDGNKIGTFVPQRADTEVITPDSYLCEGSTAWGFDCFSAVIYGVRRLFMQSCTVPYHLVPQSSFAKCLQFGAG